MINMYGKYFMVFATFVATEDTSSGLLSKLGEYGILGIVLAIMLYKDYKNEQFLQKLIDDLKISLDKMADTIDKKIK